VILHRLEELGLDSRSSRAPPRDESYISQLLTRRKAPPAPNRTDIYDRMDKFLKLPSGELASWQISSAGRIEAGIGGRARPLVSRSPRADPAQV